MEYERCNNDWCTQKAVADICPFDEDVNGKERICTCCTSCRRECLMDI